MLGVDGGRKLGELDVRVPPLSVVFTHVTRLLA